MPSTDHPAALAPEKLWEACEVRRLRRSGPGGQHRNKVETAVQVLHRPTGVKAEANERRSQAENRREAVFRLRVNLALEVRRSPPESVEPSWLWRSRVCGSRIAVSATHDDFPALLAEALDAVVAYEANVQRAASHLRVSGSQLVRFLAQEPRALALVNRWRKERALRPLRP